MILIDLSRDIEHKMQVLPNHPQVIITTFSTHDEIRTADGYQIATRALALVDPDSELSGAAHFAVGGSAVSLGMPAEGLRHLELAAKLASGADSLSIGTRADVHGTAWAAHAHWLLGHDDDALSACREAIRLARSIDHPYSLAVASPTAASPIRCATTRASSGTPSVSCASCAAGMSSPTIASGL